MLFIFQQTHTAHNAGSRQINKRNKLINFGEKGATSVKSTSSYVGLHGEYNGVNLVVICDECVIYWRFIPFPQQRLTGITCVCGERF